MDQILRNAGGTVQVTLYDDSGDPANPPVGAITADVKDSAGAAITGSPFAVTNPPAATGVLKFTVPVGLTQLDVYDVTWNISDSTKRYTQFEMVGSFLFAIKQLQIYETKLGDETKYPLSTVREIRSAITERFARRFAFTLRGRRWFTDGSGGSRLLVPDVQIRTLVSAKVNGTALSSGDLANVKIDPIGILRWDGGTWASGIRNVELFYEYGFLTPPENVVRAAMAYARHLLLPVASEAASERATAVFTDVGGYRLSIAGRDGDTGLPEVDAVLDQFGLPAQGFA